MKASNWSIEQAPLLNESKLIGFGVPQSLPNLPTKESLQEHTYVAPMLEDFPRFRPLEPSMDKKIFVTSLSY